MAQMLGKLAQFGLPCYCCNDGRSKGQERQREKTTYRREADADVAWITADGWD